jgi:uncharacterized protein with von Willebrand factor type A (vWA) domain
MRALQVCRLLTEGLTGFVPAGDGEESGPFVGAIDFSPSMWGQSLVVAKAVGLGLAMTARELGREYILFCFASDESAIKVVTSKDGWRDHLEFCQSKTSGGTDFNMALDFAMEEIHNLNQPEKADIMFLSDGEGSLNDDMIEAWEYWKEELGTRLFYVPCDASGNAGNLPDYFNLDEVADEVILLDTLDAQGGTDLAQRVGAKL